MSWTVLRMAGLWPAFALYDGPTRIAIFTSFSEQAPDVSAAGDAATLAAAAPAMQQLLTEIRGGAAALHPDTWRRVDEVLASARTPQPARPPEEE